MIQSTIDFRTLFEALPGNFLVLQPDAPHYTIIAVSDELLLITAKLRKDVVGKSVFEVYPENPEAITATGPSAFQTSLQNVLHHKKPDQMPVIRYDVHNAEGVFEDRYWSPSSKPILNENGEVVYIIHSTIDVTDQIKAEKRQSALRKIEKTYNLFMQAPVAVCIVSGPENIVELANEENLQLIGRTSDIVGKPFFESVPEAKLQGFPELLDQVRKSGEPFYANERPITLLINGKEEVRYYNFVYHPYYENPGDKIAAGVFSVSHEVTDQVLARKKLEESEQKFRNVLEQASDPILIFKGEDLVLEVANEALFELWQVGPEALHKPFLEILPEMKGQPFVDLLHKVLHTGEPFYGYEVPAVFKRKSGKEETLYFNFSYQPYREADSSISGVLVLTTDVTERVAIKQQLVESEARFRNMVKQSPVAFTLTRGRDVVIESINPPMLRMMDKEKEEQVMGKKMIDVLPEIKDQPVLGFVLNVLDTGVAFRGSEVPVRLRIGGVMKEHYFDISYTPFIEEGVVTGVIHIATDVTERVLAYKKIEESEQFLRNVILTAPVAMNIFKGPSFVVELANDRMFDVWGRPSEAILNKPIFEALPEAKGFGFEELLSRVYTTGETVTAEEGLVHLPRNGKVETVYVTVVYAPYRENDGPISGIIAVAVDVTEQVEARKKIEESREELKRLKFMADNAQDPFILMREDGSFAYLNQKALEVWGYTKDEAEQIRVPDVDPIYQDEQFSEIFARAQKEIIPQFETLHKRKDGHIYPVEVNMGGLTLDGKPHLFAVARNITERKKAEEAIKVKNEQLLRINNDLDNFIYTASHDLKAPISNIESLLQALLRTLPPETLSENRAGRITSLMQESVERFKKTIDNLTDVVKLQKQNNGEAVLVDLAEVIREVSLDLEPMIKASGAEVEVDVADCPAIHFSEKNLRSVVYNLLSNAIKYRSPDGVPRVQIHCSNSPEYHVLTVRDNGLGMEAGRLDQLFTMFKRFHDHVEGTGIGLYMVKKIVENVGGRIEVESQVGVGTTFRVYFKH